MLIARTAMPIKALRRAGDVPPSGCALLGLGCSATWLADGLRVWRSGCFSHAAAVNAAIVEWPGRLDIAASLHLGLLPGFLRERVYRGHADKPLSLYAAEMGSVDLCLRVPLPLRGSSGILLALLGHSLNASITVLAGLELKAGKYQNFRPAWEQAKRLGYLERCRCATPGWVQDLVGVWEPEGAACAA